MSCDVATWVNTSNQAIKGSLVMVTVIEAVAADRVAECGGLLPKNSFSRYTPSCTVPSQAGAKSGRCLPKSADFSFGCHDEL